MGLIRKLIIPLVSSVVLGTTAMATEYKVGDSMPTFSDKQSTNFTRWYNPDMSIYGQSVFYDTNGDGIPDISLTHRQCDGYKIIFGLFDKGTGKLYLDNKPYDGKIDQIIDVVGQRSIVDDAPECNTSA